jgi:hypothetical protein
VVESIGHAADLRLRPRASECPAAMASNTPATQATTTEGNSAIDIVGASRSRTTIAVPSCGLVNKTPPPAVVSAE